MSEKDEKKSKAKVKWGSLRNKMKTGELRDADGG